MNIAIMRRLALLSLGLVAGSTQAQLATNLFLDTKAMSLGNAVTADPVGIMDIHFNPAGLTKLDGRQIQFSVQNIYLNVETEFDLPENYDGEGQLLDIGKDPVAGEKGSAGAAIFAPGVGIIPLNHLPLIDRKSNV